MDAVVALLFALTCVYLILRMLRARDVVDIQLGVIGVFSIGYYALPIWFKNLSPLGDLQTGDIAVAALIHWTFLAALILGVEIGRKLISRNIGLKTGSIDKIVVRYFPVIAATSFIIYLWYYFTQDLTSYTADNFESFFADRGPFFAIIATVSSLALAFLSYGVAYAWKNRSPLLVFYAGLLLVCISLLLLLGQRLALLSPAIMLLGALGSTGQPKRAVGLLGVAVAALLLVSPIAVFIRESLADRQVTSARAAVSSFSYGDDAVGNIFQSIIDRGDLIYVTARMKPYIDAEPNPGLIYYSSVFAIPIPKAVFPGQKPYLLSTNGAPSGELSIQSWLTLLGGTGSLSAFGGIVAYREASWLGVIFNGLATGAFFVLMSRWLGRGGIVAGVFYAHLFVLITVKKVPPSFFEALSELMGMIPFILIAVIINWFMVRVQRRPSSWRPRSVMASLPRRLPPRGVNH